MFRSLNELPVIGSLCLRDDLPCERIRILVFAQTFLGSPRSRLFWRRNNLSPYIASQQVAMFVAWRSQKSWRKHKVPDPFARKVISWPPGKTKRFYKAKKHHPKKQRARSGFSASSKFSAWNICSPACLTDFPHSDFSFCPFHEDSYFSLFWDMRRIYFYCEVQFEMSKKNAYKDRGRKSVEKPQNAAGEFRIITPFTIRL